MNRGRLGKAWIKGGKIAKLTNLLHREPDKDRGKNRDGAYWE